MIETHEQAVTRGKKNRASGADFEKRTRADLEKDGWIVDKFTDNVDLKNNKITRAMNKWAGPGRPMMMGAGFPDFIAFTKIWEREDKVLGDKLVHCGSQVNQTIIGVECKVGKSLGKIEKEKCEWLLKNNVFSKIMVAYRTKEKNRIKVNYQEFKC